MFVVLYVAEFAARGRDDVLFQDTNDLIHQDLLFHLSHTLRESNKWKTSGDVFKWLQPCIYSLFGIFYYYLKLENAGASHRRVYAITLKENSQAKIEEERRYHQQQKIGIERKRREREKTIAMKKVWKHRAI
ncbi:unnamed protein product [Trifolium pratense]|uniref:Uncharacterized protein n=1 Tax=Trifolium pratense TaxID=57577 RepID=A0ACB0K815_TRIPR|nr:unnamed protein product [Trifolium pratense]